MYSAPNVRMNAMGISETIKVTNMVEWEKSCVLRGEYYAIEKDTKILFSEVI